MGELIKKIGSIRIGNSDFDIELNEGYVENGEECIHIQNHKYRYLLQISEYYSAAKSIIQAKENMIKYKIETANSLSSTNQEFAEIDIFSEKSIEDFFNVLRNEEIKYRYIFCAEKCVTLIVNKQDKNKLRDLFLRIKMKEYNHPLGIKAGYRFLYQMDPFLLYSYHGYFIEVFFQIPCMSLTKKTWIPLDKQIQKAVWEYNNINSLGVSILDKGTKLILIITWAIFKRQTFLPHEIEFINRNIDIFSDLKWRDNLSKVFFRYTDRLIKKMIKKEYDSIVYDFYMNMDY